MSQRYIHVDVRETNLNNYGVTNNTYVNMLSRKEFYLTPVISSLTPNGYMVEDTITHYHIGSSTIPVVMDFTNKTIGTKSNGKPSLMATIYITSNTIQEYIDDTNMIYIDYHKPQFIQTQTTVTRNWQESGKATLNIVGRFFNDVVGNVNQGGSYKPTVKYKVWKTGTTEPSSYITISSSNITIDGSYFYINDYSIGSSNPLSTDYLNPSYSYKVKAYVEDTFVAVSSGISDTVECDLIKGDPIWTEYADRVDFDKITINKGTTEINNTGINTNKITAGNIDCGVESITPTANTPTSKHVDFNKTFSSIPKIVVSPESAVIGGALKGVSYANVTTTGFDIYIYRTNTTSTNVSWIAIL